MRFWPAIGEGEANGLEASTGEGEGAWSSMRTGEGEAGRCDGDVGDEAWSERWCCSVVSWFSLLGVLPVSVDLWGFCGV